MRIPPVVAALHTDVHFAFRYFRRNWRWTSLALATLGTGLGVATLLACIAYGTVLRPLPYPDADRVLLPGIVPSGPLAAAGFLIGPSHTQIEAWSHARSLEDVATFGTSREVLQNPPGVADPVVVARVSPGFAKFAGARPVLGRDFTAQDTVHGAPNVAILGERLWYTLFDGRQSALNQSLTIDSVAYTIIGVYPNTLWAPSPMDLRTPDLWTVDSGRTRVFASMPIVRVRSGVSVATAESELGLLAARVGEADQAASKHAPKVALRKYELVRNATRLLVIMLITAGLALGIGFSNSLQLLLAAGMVRREEYGIRSTLGASRGRLFGQVLTESGLLYGAAGILGGVVGWAGLRLATALRPAGLYQLDSARVSGRVVAALVLLVLVLALLSAAFQWLYYRTLFAASTSPGTWTSRSLSGRKGIGRTRALLAIGTTCLAQVLVIGALLLGRSTLYLNRLDLGYDVTGLYDVGVLATTQLQSFSQAGPSPGERLAAEVRKSPGVSDVIPAFNSPPNLQFLGNTTLHIFGGDSVRIPGSGLPQINSLNADAFRLLGLRFLEGSVYQRRDSSANPVVVNRTLARMLAPHGSALGLRIRQYPDTPWQTIVGVVADAEFDGPLAGVGKPIAFSPVWSFRDASLLVRSRGSHDPTDDIRAAAVRAGFAPGVVGVQSLEQEVQNQIAPVQYLASVATALAFIGMLMAIAGLYGVIALLVAERRREFGIRITLGAEPRRLAFTVGLRGVGLAALGILCGAVISHWATQLLHGSVYGITPTDTLSVLLGALAVLLTASLACLLPARRLIKLSPREAIDTL